jgi:hypothetical protein
VVVLKATGAKMLDWQSWGIEKNCISAQGHKNRPWAHAALRFPGLVSLKKRRAFENIRNCGQQAQPVSKN